MTHKFKVGDVVARISNAGSETWLSFLDNQASRGALIITKVSDCGKFIQLNGWRQGTDYYPFACIHFTIKDTPVQHVGQDSFKLDEGKPRVGLVLREVPHALEKLGVVLGFGAEKYSVGNWKGLPDIEGRFLDSLMRHLTAYHKGEKVDPESGESHLAHAAFNIMILLEQEMLSHERI